jgi:hypothetical protein
LPTDAGTSKKSSQNPFKRTLKYSAAKNKTWENSHLSIAVSIYSLLHPIMQKIGFPISLFLMQMTGYSAGGMHGMAGKMVFFL